MTLEDLHRLFITSARTNALSSLSHSRRATLYGLAGSSVSMALSAIRTSDGTPILVIGDSPDDAGYLYFDLVRLVGEEAVAILPSGYKRDIKYGQADEPARVLRTETLNRIADGRRLRFVVTSPEALAEKVATRKSITDHTLHFRRGAEYDLTEAEKWLRDNGFTEVDYVYEPGHFAVRGSILDILATPTNCPTA